MPVERANATKVLYLKVVDYHNRAEDLHGDRSFGAMVSRRCRVEWAWLGRQGLQISFGGREIVWGYNSCPRGKTA